MECSKDLKSGTTSHELDENENPPSLNISPSLSIVNDSLKITNSELGKKCPGPESLHSPGDTLLSAGLSTSQKNALIDSGFHCENLEKISPELVNNSLCESVDNEFTNVICEEKQVSTTSGTSTHENSLNDSNDVSFNTMQANNNTSISFLFERLTLSSTGNAPSEILNTSQDNLTTSDTSNNLPIPAEMSSKDNLAHTSPFKVDIISNGSNSETNISVSPDKSLQQSHLPDHVSNMESIVNTESPNISVSPDKSLQQPHLPDQVPSMESIVPFDETFHCSNPVDVSMNTNVESLDKTVPEENNSNFAKTSFDDVFKCPLPVPESSNVLNDFSTSDNEFPMQPDDNLDGEEFQDAVQFFKDPSSFQALENINTSSTSMPRDSLYMNFDPLYRRVIQPTDVEPDGKDSACFNKISVKEEICDVNSATSNHMINKHVRESFGVNLVSFDSPIKINSDISSTENSDLKEKSVKEDSVEDNQHFLNRQALHVLAPESIGIKLDNSPLKNSSEVFSEKMCEDLNKDSLKEGICEESLGIKSRESLGINLVSFDTPNKSNSENETNKKSLKETICNPDKVENYQQEIINNATGDSADQESLNDKMVSDSPVKSSSEKNSEKDSEDSENVFVREGISDKNQPTVKKHLPRESLGGNLLSFESPLKSNFENVKPSSSKNEHKLYTEEEFQQALKIYELTLQEAYLKKQKELEEQALKQGSENVNKLNQTTNLCKILIDTISDLVSVASEQNVKVGELSSKVKSLESENQELSSNLKTTTEDLQSVEHTFSDFHKRYVQSKDMLKTYKENEDQLKTHMENLSKKLEDQEQINAKLQVKMEEMVNKANAEVASARKGGDAQLAVLKAQLKKSELKVSSLENDLKQTRIENDKLSGICDELMAKVSEA